MFKGWFKKEEQKHDAKIGRVVSELKIGVTDKASLVCDINNIDDKDLKMTFMMIASIIKPEAVEVLLNIMQGNIPEDKLNVLKKAVLDQQNIYFNSKKSPLIPPWELL